MIRSSEQLNELAPDLSKALGSIDNAKKDQTADTGKFKYQYANLAQIIDIVRPILSEHNLCILQFPGTADNGDMKLTTRIMHDSGQWLEDDFDMPITIPLSKEGIPTMPPAQAAGSVLSYMRRYSMSSIAGIAQEDDDAAPTEHGGQTYRKQDQDDDKEWYNTVTDDKDGIIGAMIGGRTADQIVENLRTKWKVSKKTVGIINDYATEATGKE